VKSVGITGGIGSGKSYIARIIEKMGYPIYYADIEAKKLMNNHPLIQKSLIDLFGSDIYFKGELNKDKLAGHIFQDENARLLVNQLVHPLVREAFSIWSSKQNSSLVFNEAAILYETGTYKQYHEIILVTAPLHERISRVIKRDKVSKEQVLDRIDAQWSDDRKLGLGPFEIINDGKQPLLIQIEEVIQQLLRE
jgi:dephospho-CoA kinase